MSSAHETHVLSVPLFGFELDLNRYIAACIDPECTWTRQGLDEDEVREAAREHEHAEVLA